MKHSEGFLKIVNDAKTRIKEVTVADTRDRLATNSGARLIDVREDDEWRAGHAAGAEHLGKGIIERDIEATVPDKSTGADLVLRRWLSLGAGRRRFAGDGLHECLVDGRWLESLAGFRRAGGRIVGPLGLTRDLT